MKLFRVSFTLFLLMIALLMGMPSRAQEATEAPAPTEEATLAATVAPTEVPTEAPTLEPTAQPPVNLPPDTIVMTGSQLFLFLLLAVFGGGGLLTIIYRFLERREARDLGEKLYEGMSPDQQQFLKDVVTGYRELSTRLLDYFDAITDGKPNDAAS